MQLSKIKFSNIILIIIILLQVEMIFYIINKNDGFKAITEKTKSYLLRNVIVSVSPISRDNIVFPTNTDLSHFYEPKENSVITNSQTARPWLGDNPVYHINADSLRDRYDYAVEKPSDTFRIVVLGDSFTYGLYVKDGENYSEVLEDNLNKLDCKNYKKFEVLNMGVSGYDLRYNIERFKIRGQKYNPDLVILFLIQDDFTIINETYLVKIEEYIKTNNPDQNEINAFGTYLQKTFEKSFMDKILEYQKKSLELFNKLYSGQLLIYSPTDFLSTDLVDIDSLLSEYVFSRPKTSLYRTNIDLVKSEKVFAGDGHPTSKGHADIAVDIQNYLIKNSLLQCK